MDFLASPLGVFAILAIVTIAAVVYQPNSYVGMWREFAKFYATQRRPRAVTFSDQQLALGKDDFTEVDVTLDDAGLWIVYNGPEAGKVPASSLVPWENVRFRRQTSSRYNFQVRLSQPVDVYVSPELGEAMRPYSQAMPDGVE